MTERLKSEGISCTEGLAYTFLLTYGSPIYQNLTSADSISLGTGFAFLSKAPQKAVSEATAAIRRKRG